MHRVTHYAIKLVVTSTLLPFIIDSQFLVNANLVIFLI